MSKREYKIYKLIDLTNGDVYFGYSSLNCKNAIIKQLKTQYNKYLKNNIICTYFNILYNNNYHLEFIETFKLNSNNFYKLTDRKEYYIYNFECVNNKLPTGEALNVIFKNDLNNIINILTSLQCGTRDKRFRDLNYQNEITLKYNKIIFELEEEIKKQRLNYWKQLRK